jgi:hypothetical protein
LAGIGYGLAPEVSTVLDYEFCIAAATCCPLRLAWIFVSNNRTPI